MKAPVSTVEGRNGLDFASVLRDCLGSALILVDSRRRITSFNEGAEKLSGIKARQARGKSIEILPQSVQQAILDTLKTGRAINERQLMLPANGRREMMLHASTLAIKGRTGRVTGAAVVLNDLSSARKWESNMRRLDRLHNVGALSASMAHEVKNAFVAIKTFVDLLLEQNKQADLVEIVRLEMGRIESMLGQMRKFSRPARPEFSTVRLHQVMERSLQLIQHLLEEKKMTAARSLAAAQDTLQGDADQLEQVFINLFFNALDAMKPGGRLTVTTEMVPTGARVPGLKNEKGAPLLRVQVRDDGAGISTANMDRLFEPFFTTKPDGTGLGLAITRRIIHEHNGVIFAQSEVDKGTTFSLVLPVTGAN